MLEGLLSSVLKINEHGEIKSRYDWREIFGESFAAQPPKLSYLRYELWCKTIGRTPSLEEWLALHNIQKDETA